MFARAIDTVSDRTEVGQRRSIRQVAFASFIGTAVEWYDFFVYGTLIHWSSGGDVVDRHLPGRQLLDHSRGCLRRLAEAKRGDCR
jgi:hypothetical protein